METTINSNLENLQTEIKSFKEMQLSKLNNQEKRLKKIEDQHYLAHKRPNFHSNTEGNDEYKKKLFEYLKKGITDSNEIKSDGFPLRYDVIDGLSKYSHLHSRMRKLASVDRISVDYATYVTSKGGDNAQWVQNSTIPESINLTDDIIIHNIYTHELCIQPKVTLQTLEDSLINIENWVQNYAGIAFAKHENLSFINGDGRAMPVGLLNYNSTGPDLPIPEIDSIEANKISFDDLINLFYKLPNEMQQNASFLMHPSTLSLIRSLKYPQSGQYIWQPNSNNREPDTILGIPVFTSSDMPTYEQHKDIIAIADFKRCYKIVDRSEIRILRDPYSAKPYISFYITKRVGGNVIDPKAALLFSQQYK